MFAPRPPMVNEERTPFVVMLPPPNITGSLHMGHALQDTIIDVLVRWHRMQGEVTLWLPGTDHAALPTNRILEKQLKAERLTKEKIGRAEFLRRSEEWYSKTGSIIIDQMKKLGTSCDWDRRTFTMDPEYVQAVQEAFVRYYNRDLIYRGNRIVNWCLRCASVISDLEIKYEERTTKLYEISYPLKDSTEKITVSTTRPETMLGDTAVAVHPHDARYTHIVGKMAILPLSNREIPIIADERIDQKFGTGAVKITPAHDVLDNEIGLTHKLPIINVIGEDGFLTAQAGNFTGLTVAAARQAVVEKLKEMNAFVNEQDHVHKIATCERCGTVIEPLVSRQWFVKMKDLARQAIAVADQDLITFTPPRWKDHSIDWLKNVHDWTVSRQIWLGQQLPVWWKPGTRGTNNEEGNYVVSLTKPAGNWEQDPDVLDTWFSSALWPLATLGWPENTPDLKRFYPTSVLVTARDILYLWVVRMVFSGLELLKDAKYERLLPEDRIPFRSVLIHPTVLTKSGQRMSKSLGTGIDPLILIDQYGADATRFGLMYQMNYDRQAIRFDEAAIESARNFANKVWNMARLLAQLPERSDRSMADDWIEGRLQDVVRAVNDHLTNYRIGEASRSLYQFIWKEYADWYLEIVKVEGSTRVAREVYITILELLHPFMPHITEVLWASQGQKDLLASGPWPMPISSTPSKPDHAMDRWQKGVNVVRSARKLLGINPKATIEVQCEKSLPLPKAFEALTRATIVSSVVHPSVQFPGDDEELITLASAEITEESLQATQQKLQTAMHKLEELIISQQQVLNSMKEKAPAERVATKQAEVAVLEAKRAEIKENLSLLRGVHK